MTETWLLNETITSALAEQTVNFVSSGSEFVGIKSIAVTSGFELKYYVQQGSSTTDLPAYDTTNGWLDTAYRQITFAIPPTGDLLTWLQANGNKQVSRKSYDLSTSAKWATLSSGNYNVQIVAKASGYRDSEKSAAVTVNKTIISAGTYKFNDTITAPASGSAVASIKFKVNNTSYNSIGVTSLVSVMYTETLGEGITVYNNTDKWAAVDTANQIITITADKEVPYKFYEWFTANASAYTPTYTLEAGTYKFIESPVISGKVIEQNLNGAFNSMTKVGNTWHLTTGQLFNSISLGRNGATYDLTIFGTSGEVNLIYRSSNNKWIPVHNNVENLNAPVSYYDTFRTITLSTAQQVSADFYKWAITDGNLVKQVEPATPQTRMFADSGFHNTALTKTAVNFTSNGTKYTAIEMTNNILKYYNQSDVATSVYDNSTSTWTDFNYRRVVFDDTPTGDLLTWLGTGAAAGNSVIMEDGYKYVQFTPGANSTTLSNMDTTKKYSMLCITEGNTITNTVLSYNGTAWQQVVAGNTLITEQTSNSITMHVGGGDYFGSFKAASVIEGPEALGKLSPMFGYNAVSTSEVLIEKMMQSSVMAVWVCITEGTLVTLSDRTTKPIEEITYDDDLLVWNFYEGKFDSAKPCWIIKPQVADRYNLCKFSNGTEIGFVGQGGKYGYHRIYNDEAKAFTHTGVPETPVGTHTFAEDKTTPILVEQTVIEEPIRFYNIGTQKHINIFANGILTSARISNKYAIDNMKYIGERLISEQEEKEYIDKVLKRC